MDYRVVFTLDGAFEDVVIAETLTDAKRKANDLIQHENVGYAGVYDHQDHEVYQAFASERKPI